VVVLKRLLIIVVIIIAVIASCGNVKPPDEPIAKGHLVTETYTVISGDTLDEISYKFMAKSSVRRDIREFREGIIEENWDSVFKGRYPHGLIYPGDRLVVNYWVQD
jgi:hypothetical protein